MIIVRSYKPGDEVGICEAHIRSIQQICSKDYSPEAIKIWSDCKPEKYVDSIEKNNERFHVIEDNQKIVGFSGWYGEGIVGFYMDPDYVGQGFARELFEVTEKDYWENSGNKMCRITSTITAKPFYEYMGFKVVKKDEHTFKRSQGNTTVEVWRLEKGRPNV